MQLLIALSSSVPLRAQTTQPAGPLPGHSYHGEAFDQGPRRAAYLMGDTGNLNFPITTRSDETQKFFNQGVGQLHGFWYFEAERSFRHAASLDPDCAMAYWGMAMSNKNEKRAKAFIAEAVKRKKGLTRREEMYTDALNAYYRTDEKDNKNRRRTYVRALESIVQSFPDDVEAKAFLAFYIWEWRQTLPISSHQAYDSLLELVFHANPMHPAHHYRIHLWDDEKAERALSAAARCGQSAPAIAHMWHMPGHTYSKLHRHADAVFHQEASARVDHAHMMRDRVMPYQIHNYAHNNEWLVRSLVAVGRVNDAVALAKNMIELPRHPKHNLHTNRGSGAAMGRDRLLDVLTMHEMWDQLIALADTPYLNGDGGPDDELRRIRWLGVAHFAQGNLDDGRPQIDAIEKRLAQLQQERDDAATKAADAARGKNEPEEKVKKAADDARKGLDARVKSVEKSLDHLRGAEALARGEPKLALERLNKADLRKEYLSRIHLAAGDDAKALELAKQAVDSAKNQTYPLATQVEILHRLGKADNAKDAFARLRQVSAHIDLSVHPYARLADIAADFGLPRDWRLPYPQSADTLPRPTLDALGPFRWRPSPAPPWTLASADDRPISLADYDGRALLILFYLGHGCTHCNAQLNTFAPLAKDFADAGISIIAISTDAPDQLRKSPGLSHTDGGLPFPLVSDHALTVFRQYHAYDDFEKMPLHAAVLIDPRGLVRWQDISPDPFTDAKFLLAESKRLLKLPDAGVASR